MPWEVQVGQSAWALRSERSQLGTFTSLDPHWNTCINGLIFTGFEESPWFLWGDGSVSTILLTVISYLHLGVVGLACCFAKSHWEVIEWDMALTVPQRCLCCSPGDLQDTCSCSAIAQEHSVSLPCDTPGELQEGREQAAKLMKPTFWVFIGKFLL